MFIFERQYHFSLRNDDIKAVTVCEVSELKFQGLRFYRG